MSQKVRKIGKNEAGFQSRAHSHRTAHTNETKGSVTGMATQASTQCSEEPWKGAFIGRSLSTVKNNSSKSWKRIWKPFPGELGFQSVCDLHVKELIKWIIRGKSISMKAEVLCIVQISLLRQENPIKWNDIDKRKCLVMWEFKIFHHKINCHIFRQTVKTRNVFICRIELKFNHF